MKRFVIFLIYGLLIGCFALLLPTCTKEYSYEGSNSTAITVPIADTASFTLIGAPADCSVTLPPSYLVAGGSINQTSINITVDVTKTGDYTISTDTLDNIYFSASGSFTKTGVQKVTMKGYGTPDTALNLGFTPSTSFTRCTFLLSIVPSGPLGTYVIESNYGNPNPCSYQVNGNYSKGQQVSSLNTVRISVTAISTGNFAIATEIVNGIRFSYSGSFTATGSQYVFLKASGTPLTSGTFSFTPTIVGPSPLGGKACAFNVTFQ